MGQVHSFDEQGPSDFRFQIRQEGRWVVLQCSGSLEQEVCDVQLQPELLKLHEQLLSSPPLGVRLELREVDYLSSSALKLFAYWFVKLAEAGSAGYAVLVTYDPEREWQAQLLKALQMLAPGQVGLEPIRRVHAPTDPPPPAHTP